MCLMSSVGKGQKNIGFKFNLGPTKLGLYGKMHWFDSSSAVQSFESWVLGS